MAQDMRHTAPRLLNPPASCDGQSCGHGRRENGAEGYDERVDEADARVNRIGGIASRRVSSLRTRGARSKTADLRQRAAWRASPVGK